MVRLAATLASIGGIVVTLSGCGDSATTTSSPANSTSSAPAPSSGSSTNPASSTAPSTHSSDSSTTAKSASTTTGSAAPDFTTPPPGGKTPLYVVLRMDDISPVDHADVQTAVMSWMVDNNVKFNFGIIVGGDPTDEWSPYWPTNCQENPNATYCDDQVVMRVKQAYENGEIVGTGPNAVLELGNHAYNHAGWGGQWAGYVPAANWSNFQDADFKQSQEILTGLYPNARIKSFHAPENCASADNLASMKKYGLEIISTAGTISHCGADKFWLTGPCGVQKDDGSIVWECAPGSQGIADFGEWATVDGFARVNDIVSAPAGSANSLWSGGAQAGVSVDKTIGVGDCGCTTEDGSVWCSVIASATNNADISNGLHWTVLMMHPQTGFGEQSYTQWLDEFLEKMNALTDYTPYFINFQDLAQLSAPPPAAEGALFM